MKFHVCLCFSLFDIRLADAHEDLALQMCPWKDEDLTVHVRCSVTSDHTLSTAALVTGMTRKQSYVCRHGQLRLSETERWGTVGTANNTSSEKRKKKDCAPFISFCDVSTSTLAPTKMAESYDQPRQHIKKQRHYFVNKDQSSQGYGFSSGHVWMWELDYEES